MDKRGGHGTTVTYTDLENTDIEAEYPWKFVDTTSDIIDPITEEVNTGGHFNPFIDGYLPEDQGYFGYESERTEQLEPYKASLLLAHHSKTMTGDFLQ